MSDFRFLKGGDITITADGKPLGGVVSATCGARTLVENIQEFLTDDPVAQLERKSFVIELKLNAPSGSSAVKNFSPVSVAFEDKHERICYTHCRVESAVCEINPEGELEYVFKLSAKKRSVENV